MYAPARLPAASKDTAASLVQVLSDVTAGYVDNVSPAGAQSLRVADLARNSGAVVQEGIKKVRSYAGTCMDCWQITGSGWEQGQVLFDRWASARLAELVAVVWGW